MSMQITIMVQTMDAGDTVSRQFSVSAPGDNPRWYASEARGLLAELAARLDAFLTAVHGDLPPEAAATTGRYHQPLPSAAELRE